MATTTNFGWETPDDTDLVKDGALAMRTLGNAIDASLVDLKGGTTGQVLSKTSNTDMDFTWVTSDDANAIQNAIVDAKGDLIAATAADTPARLAVGNNGETLVADSSASTGLRWQGNFAAGKNKLINGDFNINQRGFSSTTTTATFGFDRWVLSATDGTTTYSAQTFTLGTAPVAGYEGKNFARLVSSGQTATNALSALNQPIEGVRTFAGETITVSFWAKASTGTPNITVFALQNFGGGGSASAPVFIGANNKQAISTSWARYSFQLSIPSIAGKTIDGGGDLLRIYVTTSAGSDRNSYTNSLGIQSATIDIWGVQAESGSVATAFQTATGTLAGELAACQRYYYRQPAAQAYSNFSNYSPATSTTVVDVVVSLPTTMRVVPTSVDYASIAVNDNVNTPFSGGTVTITGSGNSTNTLAVRYTHGSAALTQYRSYAMIANNTTSAYLGFSAEL